MLSKLIKYEWKAVCRVCLPLYGVLLAVSLVNRFLLNRDHFGLAQFMGATAYAVLFAAVVVVTFVILVNRFYKSLLGDEGYLMFTLPVTPAQHIWSKGIVAVGITLVAMLAAFLSGLLLGGVGLKDVGKFLKAFVEFYGGVPIHMSVGCTLEGIAVVLAGMFACAMFFYLCIALGHLASKHRGAASVGAFFGLVILEEVIAYAVLTATGWENLWSWAANIPKSAAPHVFLLTILVLEVAVSAVYFLVTRWVLSRKLNLE